MDINRLRFIKNNEIKNLIWSFIIGESIFSGLKLLLKNLRK